MVKLPAGECQPVATDVRLTCGRSGVRLSSGPFVISFRKRSIAISSINYQNIILYMRLQLEKGFQRKLIEIAKTENGFTWRELAEKLNHCEGYLRAELRHEKTIVSEECYIRLCRLANRDFDEKIVRKMPSNWGQSKGGKNSIRKPKKPKILVEKLTCELAEIFGIMLGDGNIWSKKGYYYIRITGNAKNDKKYLLQHVKPLFQKVFGIRLKPVFINNKNEMFLRKGSKDLIYTFEVYGLPRGSKKVNNVGIPEWIFKSKEYLKACIRGLIDTDGCVCSITGRNYTYIWFKSSIPSLRSDFSEAMQRLGFKIAKWTSKNGTPQTYIGQKELIKKYYREIGFNNPKHIERFKMPP